MAANRKCALCKLSQPMDQMFKAGRGSHAEFLCLDATACYKRRLIIQDDAEKKMGD